MQWVPFHPEAPTQGAVQTFPDPQDSDDASLRRALRHLEQV